MSNPHLWKPKEPRAFGIDNLKRGVTPNDPFGGFPAVTGLEDLDLRSPSDRSVARASRFLGAFFVACLVLGLAFAVGLLVCAVHFIAKVW